MVIRDVKEFVQIMMRSIILFYQLDLKSSEISEICLQNLVTSLVLKNPVYTLIIDLIKVSYRAETKLIEQQIDDATNNYDL